MKPFSIYHEAAPDRKHGIHSGREAIEFALQHYDHSHETRHERLLTIIGKMVEIAAKERPKAVLDIVGLKYFKVDEPGAENVLP